MGGYGEMWSMGGIIELSSGYYFVVNTNGYDGAELLTFYDIRTLTKGK